MEIKGSFWNEKWVKVLSDLNRQIKRERGDSKWMRSQGISGQTDLEKFVLKYSGDYRKEN